MLVEKVRGYQSAADAETVQVLSRIDHERQRQGLVDLKNSLEYQEKVQEEELGQEKGRLTYLRNPGELESERGESIEHSRKTPKRADIKVVPFYRTVELSKNPDETYCVRLEIQL